MAIIGANGVVYDIMGNVTGSVDEIIASTIIPLPAIPKSFTQLKKESQTNRGNIAKTETTPQGKLYEPNKPKVTNIGDTSLVGAPTVPNLARGIVDNTGIAVANNEKVHVCDTTLYIQRNVNLGKIAASVTKAIRDAIDTLLDFLGISPGGNGLIQQIKSIARRITDAINFLQRVQTAIDTFVIVVKEIRDVITYILTLPSRLLAYFTKCLTEATKELSKQFGDIVKQTGGVGGLGDIVDETNSLIKDTQTLVTTGIQTINVATTTLPSALLGATTAAEANDAKQFLSGDGQAVFDEVISEAFAEFTPDDTTFERA